MNTKLFQDAETLRATIENLIRLFENEHGFYITKIGITRPEELQLSVILSVERPSK